MDELERALKLWAEQSTKAAQRKADAYVEAGTASWQLDPHVKNVVGLVLTGTNCAIVVIYLERQDFEVDDDYF